MRFSPRSVLPVLAALVPLALAPSCGGDSDSSPLTPSDAGSADSGTGGSSGDCVGTQCQDNGGDEGGLGGDGSSLGGTTSIPDTFECPVESTGEGLDSAPLEVEDAAAVVSFHTNQVGYELDGAKRAVIESSSALSSFQILRTSDSRVFYEGDLSSVDNFVEWGSSNLHLIADFSDLGDAGTYVLRVNGEESEPFEVGTGQLWKSTGADVLSFFLNSRADEADAAIWSAGRQRQLPRWWRIRRRSWRVVRRKRRPFEVSVAPELRELHESPANSHDGLDPRLGRR